MGVINPAITLSTVSHANTRIKTAMRNAEDVGGPQWMTGRRLWRGYRRDGCGDATSIKIKSREKMFTTFTTFTTFTNRMPVNIVNIVKVNSQKLILSFLKSYVTHLIYRVSDGGAMSGDRYVARGVL